MSDTYSLSAARRKELKERRKNFRILEDWYGTEYARTEITAHSPAASLLSESIDDFIKTIDVAEYKCYIELVANWRIIGGALANLASPAGLKDGVLLLSVRHSALIRELQGISELLLPKLHDKFGSDLIKGIKLISSSGGRR